MCENLSDGETLEYCRTYGIKLSKLEMRQVFLMHGEVGAIIAREKYGVEDEIVLNAIKFHTTGNSDMNMMDKIIFLADYIEPGRTHTEVDTVRKLAYEDINRALVVSFDNIIKYIIRQNGLIHPNTILARNNILMLISDIKTDL